MRYKITAAIENLLASGIHFFPISLPTKVTRITDRLLEILRNNVPVLYNAIMLFNTAIPLFTTKKFIKVNRIKLVT